MKRVCLPAIQIVIVFLGGLVSSGCGKPEITPPTSRPPVVQQMNIQLDAEAEQKAEDPAPVDGGTVD
jgi:hypothetical protein